MKTKNLLILGVAGVGAYLLINKLKSSQATTSADLGTVSGGSTNPSSFLDMFNPTKPLTDNFNLTGGILPSYSQTTTPQASLINPILQAATMTTPIVQPAVNLANALSSQMRFGATGTTIKPKVQTTSINYNPSSMQFQSKFTTTKLFGTIQNPLYPAKPAPAPLPKTYTVGGKTYPIKYIN